MESEKPDKKIEKLSRAITEAILRSSRVRDALLELQKEDIINAGGVIMLVMRTDGLAQLADSIQKFRRGPKKRHRQRKQYIDGKEVSAADAKLIEYLADSFDEADWLKKNRLIF